MSDFKTEQIANFTLALTTAFELLADYRESKLGKCFSGVIFGVPLKKPGFKNCIFLTGTVFENRCQL